MRKRDLPTGITESKTEPWFRYSRGQLAKPRYFYYGSKITRAEARQQAIAYAKRENRRWDPKIASARIGRMSKSNRSGVVGVSIKTEKSRRRGMKFRYWFARWPACPSGVKFSILEHNDAKAFCLALIARELETRDKAAVERAYVARKKSGKLRALLAKKAQKA